MKRAIIIVSTFMCISAAGQVGIGTTNPQETLHINGSLRVTDANQPSITSINLSGMDANGTIRRVNVGTNLTLKNNTISSKSDHSFGSLNLNANATDKFNNVDLQIGVGESNEGKTIIRIFATKNGDPEKIKITGLKAGYNGQNIWIYSQSEEIIFETLNNNSLANNRIQVNDKKTIKKWGMIQLVYDATNLKWIIMQN